MERERGKRSEDLPSRDDFGLGNELERIRRHDVGSFPRVNARLLCIDWILT